MESQKEDYGSRALRVVMRNLIDLLPEEPWPDRLPEEVEELLWDYALGLLELPEEERVIAILAWSQRAEEALAEIRNAMAEAGMALPIEPGPLSNESELLRRAWQKLRAVLSVLGQQLKSLAAVVANTGNRLIWSQEDPGTGLDLRGAGLVRWAAQPVCLDFRTDIDSQRLGGGIVEIDGPTGLSAKVHRISTDRVDLIVRVGEPVIEGKARMFQLVPKEAGVEELEVGLGEWLREGEAKFEDCPAGLLKIVVPDGRELSIFLDTGNP